MLLLWVAVHGTIRKLFYLLTALVWLLILIVATPLAYWIATPLMTENDARPSDAIVLFSSGQIDQHWLTTDAAQRTWGALDLYRRGFAPLVMASGSQHDAGYSQAEIEASWLRTAGVPETAILVESQSTRTYESVRDLQRIMQSRGWHTAVIVTSQLDVPRIRMLCRRMGLNGITYYAVPTDRPPKQGHVLYTTAGYSVFHHAVYEYAAMLLYKCKGWI